MKSFYRKYFGSGRKIIVKFLLFGIFALGFLWFALPVPLYGVFNVGTCIGLAAFGLGMALTLFWESFTALLGRLWSRAPGRVLLVLVCAALLAAVGTAGVFSGKMLGAMKKAPAGDETVVVLGCFVRDTGPSKSLARRIEAAKDYLERHPDAVCVCSGGQGPDENMSEAQCIFDELTAAGVDPARLYLEDRSTSTQENIAFSMEVIRANGLSENIAVVTNGYHQYRASLIARQHAQSVSAIPARTPVILIPTYVVRELCGILYETLSQHLHAG